MTDREIENIYAATSEMSLDLKVPFIPKNWMEALKRKIGLIKGDRILKIKPITLGARERYSIYAQRLNLDEMQKGVDLTRLHNIMASGKMDALIMCIAIAIQNNEKPVKKWLLQTVRKFDDSHLISCVNILVNQINTQNFLSSIISLTGMSLKPEEIIASEKQEQKTRGAQEVT